MYLYGLLLYIIVLLLYVYLFILDNSYQLNFVESCYIFKL